MAIPDTTTRVAAHTPEWLSEKIEQEIEQRLYYYQNHPEEIALRLRELDAEWDMERALETNAAAIGLAFMGLGAVASRRFFIMPAVVMGFLLQHAIQGWCPPVSLFRRLGFRTQSEIDLERYALKALRGDFGELGSPSPTLPEHRAVPDKVLSTIRK